MITRWDLNELTHSEDELYHHGVLGMRWGHRKVEARSSNVSRRPQGTSLKQYKPSRAVQTRKTNMWDRYRSQKAVQGFNEAKAARLSSRSDRVKTAGILGALGAVGGTVGAASAGAGRGSFIYGGGAGIGGFIGALGGAKVRSSIYKNDKYYNRAKRYTQNVLKKHGHKLV